MATDKELSYYLFRVRDIPHYYGDYIRDLFLASALVSIVAIPLLGDLLPFGTIAQIGTAVLLVLLAGLTNPHSRIVMWYNAIASAIGTVLFESAAINLYSAGSTELFLAREFAALALMLAFYFSVKTLRAMLLGKLGKIERPWEFENVKDKTI